PCETTWLRAGLGRLFRTAVPAAASGCALPPLKNVCLIRLKISVADNTSASGTTAESKAIELSLAVRAAFKRWEPFSVTRTRQDFLWEGLLTRSTHSSTCNLFTRI